MGFVGNLVLFAAVKEFHKAPFLTYSVQLTILRRHMMYTTENYGNGQPQQPDTHDCRCLCLHILTRIDSNNCPSVCLFSSTHPLPTTYDDPDIVSRNSERLKNDVNDKIVHVLLNLAVRR